MKSAFLVRTRDKKPFFSVLVSDEGSKFTPLVENAKELVSALVDEYDDSPIPKAELAVSLDRGMTIDGPMPVNMLASAIKKAEEDSKESSAQQKMLPTISISDAPISIFSTEEAKAIISYKASAFVAERQKTTFNYEIKRVRATWDPTLSIPGTNRRGGWRCPTGTRYGGQITDRFGRNCGWGVARRLANAITNIGERLENVDDRRRGRRVNRRNDRMINRLQNVERGGRLERGLRGIADRLEGDNQNRTPEAIEAPVAPRLPNGANRRPRQPRAVVAQPEAVRPERQPRPARPRRGNLRDSERRRMEREIENPGAPRTGDDTTPPIPQGEAQPVAPTPRPRRQRRRNASEQQAERVATRRPQADDVPDAGPQPKKPARRQVSKPRVVELPERGLGGQEINQLISRADISDKKRRDLLARQNRAELALDNNSEQLAEAMPRWRAGDEQELQANIDLQQNRVAEKKREFEDAARSLAGVEANRDMQPAQKQAWRAAYLERMISSNEDYMMALQTEDAMRERLFAIRGENPNRPAPAPQAPPAPPAQPAPQANNPPALPRQDAEKPLNVALKTVGVNIGADTEKRVNDKIKSDNPAANTLAARLARWDFIKKEANGRAVEANYALVLNLDSLNQQLTDGQMLTLRKRGMTFRFVDKASAERELAEAKQSLDGNINNNINLDNPSLQRDIQRIAILQNVVDNWDADSEIFRRKISGEKFFNADGTAPRARIQDLGEAGAAIEREIQAAVAKRQSILGKHLDEKYGKNIPYQDMTPEKFDALTDREKTDYIKFAYSHDLIKGQNGKLYKAEVVGVSGNGGPYSVSVIFHEIDKDGTILRRGVGDSSRQIYMRDGYVYNQGMNIRGIQDRGAGIQTIYNQHAFMFLGKVGVTEARVTAVSDGAFVWGRIGYKNSTNVTLSNFEREMRMFENFGPGGLISNEEEYYRVKYLVEKQRRGERVFHQDWIFAVAQSGGDRKSRELRETMIKEWFKVYANFSGGTLQFSEQGIPFRRRNRPAPARRPRA